MKISKNLTLADLTASKTATANNIQNVPEPEHITNMISLAKNIVEPLLTVYGSNLHINSCYRNKWLNKLLHGALNSQHMKGQAIDFSLSGSSNNNNANLFNFIKDNMDYDQLIWEKGTRSCPQWVHVSFNLGHNRKQIIYNI